MATVKPARRVHEHGSAPAGGQGLPRAPVRPAAR